MFLKEDGDLQYSINTHFSVFDSIKANIIRMNPRLGADIQSEIDKLRNKINSHLNTNLGKKKEKDIITWVKRVLSQSLKDFREDENLTKNAQKKDRAEVLAELPELPKSSEKTEIPPSPAEMFLKEDGDLQYSINTHFSVFDSIKTNIVRMNPRLGADIQSEIDKLRNEINTYLNDNLGKKKDEELVSLIDIYLKGHVSRFKKFEKLLEDEIGKPKKKEKGVYKSKEIREFEKRTAKDLGDGIGNFVPASELIDLPELEEESALVSGVIDIPPSLTEIENKFNKDSKRLSDYNANVAAQLLDQDSRLSVRDKKKDEEIKLPEEIGKMSPADKSIVMSNRFDDLKVDKTLFNIQKIYDKENLGKLKNKFDLLRMSPKELLSYLRKILKNLKGKGADNTVKKVKKIKRWAKDALVQG